MLLTYIIAYLAVGTFWFLLIINQDIWTEECNKIIEREGKVVFLINYFISMTVTICFWPFFLVASVINIGKQ